MARWLPPTALPHKTRSKGASAGDLALGPQLMREPQAAPQSSPRPSQLREGARSRRSNGCAPATPARAGLEAGVRLVTRSRFCAAADILDASNATAFATAVAAEEKVLKLVEVVDAHQLRQLKPNEADGLVTRCCFRAADDILDAEWLLDELLHRAEGPGASLSDDRVLAMGKRAIGPPELPGAIWS
jgi:hypothetical protein